MFKLGGGLEHPIGHHWQNASSPVKLRPAVGPANRRRPDPQRGFAGQAILNSPDGTKIECVQP